MTNDVQYGFADGPLLGRGNFSSSVRLGLSDSAAVAAGAPPTVALKRCAVGNASHTAALRREFALLRAMRGPGLPRYGTHPGIIAGFELRESESELCLVLEHAAGGDLRGHLQRTSMCEAEARSVCRQLLRALVVLHGRSFAHRDVKPRNILVTTVAPLEVKLADFGLAKPVEGGMCRQNSSGDYAFMPPDFRECTEDHMPMSPQEYFKSDTYAVGLTLAAMVAGCGPGDGDVATLRLPRAVAARFWPRLSAAGLDAAATLLAESASDRPDAEAALRMPWFAADDDDGCERRVAASSRCGSDSDAQYAASAATTAPLSPLPERSGSSLRE